MQAAEGGGGARGTTCICSEQEDRSRFIQRLTLDHFVILLSVSWNAKK